VCFRNRVEYESLELSFITLYFCKEFLSGSGGELYKTGGYRCEDNESPLNNSLEIDCELSRCIGET
jgi:hypothetical protein